MQDIEDGFSKMQQIELVVQQNAKLRSEFSKMQQIGEGVQQNATS